MTWERIMPKISTKEGFYRVKKLAPMTLMSPHAIGDAITPDSKTPLYQTDYYPVLFAKAFQLGVIDENFDYYGKLKDWSESFGKAYRKTMNKYCAETLSNGFTVTGYDSVALFSASHPNTGKAASSTWSNLSTYALGTVGLAAAVASLLGQTDENGDPLEIEPPFDLHVPVALYQTANEITKSDLKAFTADNTMNYMKGIINVDLQRYLSSATSWFLKSSDSSEHGLRNIMFKDYFTAEGGEVLRLAKYYVAATMFRPVWVDAHGIIGKA
jgi:hypothetical protein